MNTRIFTSGLLLIIMVSLLSAQASAQCCVAPTNLRVKSLGRTEADLKWSRVFQGGCTTPVRYKVQYRVLGATTWTTVMVRTKKDDLTGDTTVRNLTPATTYQWRVQGICSSTDKTSWVMGPNFTTLAMPQALSMGEINAYPNPVGSELNLAGSLKAGGTITVQIMNSLGQSVLERSFNLNAGKFNTTIDVSNLKSGIYKVIVNNNTGSTTLNIIKQ